MLAILGLASFMSTGLSSCSNDDDGPDSGSSKGKVNVTLGSDNLDTRFGYYASDIESSAPAGMSYMGLFFFSFDISALSGNPSNLPKTYDHVVIDYLVPEDQNDVTTITVPAGDYHVQVASALSLFDDTADWEGDSDPTADDTSDLVITRDGNKYTVTIDKCVIRNYRNSQTKTLKFKYTGSLAKLPSSLIE